MPRVLRRGEAGRVSVRLAVKAIVCAAVALTSMPAPGAAQLSAQDSAGLRLFAAFANDLHAHPDTALAVLHELLSRWASSRPDSEIISQDASYAANALAKRAESDDDTALDPVAIKFAALADSLVPSQQTAHVVFMLRIHRVMQLRAMADSTHSCDAWDKYRVAAGLLEEHELRLRSAPTFRWRPEPFIPIWVRKCQVDTL